MNNTIKYHGTEIESNEIVIEAIVDNISLSIIKHDNNIFIASLKEINYDSVIEYESYILDEYEVELLSNRESCYDFVVDFFNEYCCSYAML